jgi:hypothetical protein
MALHHFISLAASLALIGAVSAHSEKKAAEKNAQQPTKLVIEKHGVDPRRAVTETLASGVSDDPIVLERSPLENEPQSDPSSSPSTDKS